MKDFSIRLADIGDIDAVQRISAAAYGRYETEIGFVPLPAREDYNPRIARGEVWLLEARGETVGLAVIEVKADHLLLYSVAVQPDHQRQGYGLKLMAFVDERAAAHGVPEIRLFTNALMERNLAVYRQWGFVDAGRRVHPTREGHVLIDMTKRVGS